MSKDNKPYGKNCPGDEGFSMRQKRVSNYEINKKDFILMADAKRYLITQNTNTKENSLNAAENMDGKKPIDDKKSLREEVKEFILKSVNDLTSYLPVNIMFFILKKQWLFSS